MSFFFFFQICPFRATGEPLPSRQARGTPRRAAGRGQQDLPEAECDGAACTRQRGGQQDLPEAEHTGAACMALWLPLGRLRGGGPAGRRPCSGRGASARHCTKGSRSGACRPLLQREMVHCRLVFPVPTPACMGWTHAWAQGLSRNGSGDSSRDGNPN